MEPMLSESDRAEVQKMLAALNRDVTVDVYTKKSSIVVPGEEEQTESSEIAEQILGEVAALSPHVKLAVHDAAVDPKPAEQEGVAEYIPAIVFRSADTKGKLRYLGIPAGYEFKTLIDTLIALGTGEHGLAKESIDSLATITAPVNLKVYVTPS